MHLVFYLRYPNRYIWCIPLYQVNQILTHFVKTSQAPRYIGVYSGGIPAKGGIRVRGEVSWTPELQDVRWNIV